MKTFEYFDIIVLNLLILLDIRFIICFVVVCFRVLLFNRKVWRCKIIVNINFLKYCYICFRVVYLFILFIEIINIKNKNL